MAKKVDEFKDLKIALRNLNKKYGDKFQFQGSFVLAEDDGNIIDSMVAAYGDKKVIKYLNKEALKLLKEEKGDFINW